MPKTKAKKTSADQKKHSRLAPSSAHRWMVCPGSIELEAKVPSPPDSDYSKEGTAAHHLLALCLEKQQDAYLHLGREIEVKDKCFVADENMVSAVQMALDYIDQLNATSKHGPSAIETKVDVRFLHPDISGTCDYYKYDPKTKTLYVVDYKHGQGVQVDAEGNAQLRIYALGACMALAKKAKAVVVSDVIELVETTIVQPRQFRAEDRIKTESLSITELMTWAREILVPAAHRTASEPNLYQAGGHCRFCNAKAVCPAQAERAAELAKTSFKDPVFPHPGSFTPEELRTIMDVSQQFSDWATAVRQYAQDEMLRGKKIPGYKVVQKKTNRRWTDQDDAEAVLNDLLGDAAYEKKLLSVSKAEKALRNVKGYDKATVDATLSGVWEKPEGDLTIAPDDDKRHAVNVNPGEGFTALPQEENGQMRFLD